MAAQQSVTVPANNSRRCNDTNDDVVRSAAQKLAAYSLARMTSTNVGDRKILLVLFTAAAGLMFIIDTCGLAFTVQRMFQGDGKTLLAAFSVAMGVNASQIMALLARLLMLHVGNFEKREVVLRQTMLFRTLLALGSVVCVCVLLAGLLVVPTQVFASNINPQLAGCNSVGCATVMAAVGLVLNALNVCWLLSTMFTMPASTWYRWHNGLDTCSQTNSC